MELLTISEQLGELMTEDGYTRLTLAQAMDTDAAKFLGFMNDESFPSFRTFVSLTDFFHCSADFLIGLTDYPKREARYLLAPPFCEQIKKLLHAEKLSIYKLHRGAGLSDSVIRKWLKGQLMPSLPSLLRIVQYLDYPLDYIIGRVT